MMNKIIKFAFKVILVAIFVTLFSLECFAMWGKTERGGIFWVNEDMVTYPKSEWKLIDDDNDGIGYYYYFNENGFLQLDDITPDYKVVDKLGRRIDYNGIPEAKEMPKQNESGLVIDDDVYVYTPPSGLVSSGQFIISKSEDEEDLGPKPSDYIIPEVNVTGIAKILLGPGVTLRDKNESKYDPSIDKDMTKYIISSNDFSKKVNGTTFTKQKWKGVMALKGTGAAVVFENPKNNFNKLKGRIATHHFTYTDRTTQCRLIILDNDTKDELYTTEAFNYNSGCRFECLFFQSVNSIRFELEVSGQYASRVCYLRDCEFGFDKEMWEEEQYAKEIEEEHIRKYGTPSDADEEEEEEVDDGFGERSIEGEDPTARYNRLHGILDDYWFLDYDENDPELSEELRASISELKRKYAAESEERNRASGPAFDKTLSNIKVKLGPASTSNMVIGKDVKED